MAWIQEVGTGTDRAVDYRDFVAKLVGAMTSQYVATVAVNADGSGYVTGDIVKLTHGGALLDAKFEVTAVAGDITALRIISAGAFSNRLASAVVGGTPGTGYVVGDILQVQGGTSREKAKVRVATLSGSGVATVTVYESGGAYSVAPGTTNATTVGVGPTAFAGNNAATLNLTMTGMVGTTGLALTTVTGVGTGGTIDITLAEAGWSIDTRDKNNLTINSVTNERQVTLKGDAAGKTNKPYVHFITHTFTSGIDTRYSCSILSSIAHNSAITIGNQPGLSPGLSTSDVLQTDGVYMLFPQGTPTPTDQIDFWFTVDDSRVGGAINISPTSGDSGIYTHFYAGYLDTRATESEDPYPMFLQGASRDWQIDPTSASQSITGMSEEVAPTAGNAPAYFYRAETSTWITVRNSQNLSVNQVVTTGAMHPIVQVGLITTVDRIAANGPIAFYTGIGSTGRTSATRRLLPVYGSTPKHAPVPLLVFTRPGNASLDTVLDTIRGQPRGFYWVSGSNDSAATITNFSEDYITFGTDRYRVFHTHVHRNPYHFICIKEA